MQFPDDCAHDREHLRFESSIVIRVGHGDSVRSGEKLSALARLRSLEKPRVRTAIRPSRISSALSAYRLRLLAGSHDAVTGGSSYRKRPSSRRAGRAGLRQWVHRTGRSQRTIKGADRHDAGQRTPPALRVSRRAGSARLVVALLFGNIVSTLVAIPILYFAYETRKARVAKRSIRTGLSTSNSRKAHATSPR
jgi:hypothetical protein